MCACEPDLRDLADPLCRTCDGLGAYPTRGDYRTEWVRCPCTEPLTDAELDAAARRDENRAYGEGR